MILNHHDALTFVVRKNLHDGVDRIRPMGDRTRSVSCLYFARRTRAFGWLEFITFKAFASNVTTKPPPTFPFLKSQCQRAVSGTNFHHARDATPPARLCPAGGVGAVYRRPIGACQTEKNGKFVFFPRPVDGRPSHPRGLRNPSAMHPTTD